MTNTNTPNDANIISYKPNFKEQLFNFYRTVFTELGWGFDPADRHSDISDIKNAYQATGGFWCLFHDGIIIGTVAIRQIDDSPKTAELKRLYILGDYQNRGYGNLLFKYALNFASQNGFQRIRLDTQRDRIAMRHLINMHGFFEIECYNNNLYAELFYEKILSPGKQ